MLLKGWVKLQVMPFSHGHAYAELRVCTITRLIHVNGCRRKQPSRLFISDWKDAENDIWLDKKCLKEIAGKIKEAKITLQSHS